MADCVFGTSTEALALASSFPLLEHLHLDHIDWYESDFEDFPRGSHLPLLSLSIRYCLVNEWLIWLLSFDSLPPLQALKSGGGVWGGMDPDDAIESCILNQFLRGLGSSLEHLHIDERADPDVRVGEILSRTSSALPGS
jgi:hypothetical protein